MAEKLIFCCQSPECDGATVEIDMGERYTRVKLVCMGCEEPMHWRPRYPEGARVWLPAFDDQPREIAVVNPQEDFREPWRGGMYSASVRPHDPHDDGEREISEDQIESVICAENHITGGNRCGACGKRWLEP